MRDWAALPAEPIFRQLILSQILVPPPPFGELKKGHC